MKKKLFAILVSLCMFFIFTACGGGSESESQSETQTETQTETQSQIMKDFENRYSVEVSDITVYVPSKWEREMLGRKKLTAAFEYYSKEYIVKMYVSDITSGGNCDEKYNDLLDNNPCSEFEMDGCTRAAVTEPLEDSEFGTVSKYYYFVCKDKLYEFQVDTAIKNSEENFKDLDTIVKATDFVGSTSAVNAVDIDGTYSVTKETVELGGGGHRDSHDENTSNMSVIIDGLEESNGQTGKITLHRNNETFTGTLSNDLDEEDESEYHYEIKWNNDKAPKVTDNPFSSSEGSVETESSYFSKSKSDGEIKLQVIRTYSDILDDSSDIYQGTDTYILKKQ